MRRRWMIVLLAAVAGVLVAAVPAHAHGDEGTIEVVSVTASSPLALRVETNITFVGDGHAAPEATATVVAERAGATTVGPIVLTASGAAGRYGATITLPSAGDWTLRFTSLSPTAVAERRQTVSAPPTTTAAPVTTAPVTTTNPSSTTAVVTSTTTGGVAPLTSTAAGGPSDGADADENHVATTFAFIGVLLAVAVVATLAVRSSRRARRSSGAA